MEDVDAFLASLDQLSSPTIDAGIQRQRAPEGSAAASPTTASASHTATASPPPPTPQQRRRPREDTEVSTSPRMLSTGVRTQDTWWCVRCTAENDVHMQSCAICHRRRHRAEGPRPSEQTAMQDVPPAAPTGTPAVGAAPTTSAPPSSFASGVQGGGGGGGGGGGAASPRQASAVAAGPGEVSCPRCTFLNPDSRRTCEMCLGALPPKPAAVSQWRSGAVGAVGGSGEKPGPSPVVAGGGAVPGLIATAGTAVPSTLLPALASVGRRVAESDPGQRLARSPEPAPSAAAGSAWRVEMQEATRATLSLSPVLLGGRDAETSSSSSEESDVSDVSEALEDAAVYNAADHRELVHFLETLQSVKFESLPCAAVPASMLARASLRPFQLQALHWLLSREQPPSTCSTAAAEARDPSDRDVEAGRKKNKKGEGSSDGDRADGLLTHTSTPRHSGSVESAQLSSTGDSASLSSGEQDMVRTVRGGVFADYMGLGKTRTLIALCEAARTPRVDRVTGSLVESAATLVVCPTALLTQWVSEIQQCVERPSTAPLRLLVYYGAARHRHSLFQVAQSYDYVLTTYQTLCREQPPASALRRLADTGAVLHDLDGAGDDDDDDGGETVPPLSGGLDEYSVDHRLQTEVGKLFLVRWGRIILDEAHYIRNMRTRQSRACLKLSGVCRWAVTATPAQNSLNDLYPLLRFLNVPHFSVLTWWNEEIVRYYNLDPHHPRPVTALSILFGAILLRRTPDSLVGGRPILEMPPKRTITRTVALSRDEMRFYQSIHAKATEKLTALRDREAHPAQAPLTTFTTAFEMLVRCRQTCLHPYIVVAALRRCRRLPGAAAAAVLADDNHSGAASAAGGAIDAEAARRQREADVRAARAMEEFIQGVVLRRLRSIKASEYVQSLVAEIKRQQLEARECIICLDTVNRPAILPCAHVFCEACITHALQEMHRCPLCKRSSRPSELLLVPVELLGRAAPPPASAVAGIGTGGSSDGAAEPPPTVPLSLDLADMHNWPLHLSSKTQYVIDTIQALPAEDKVVIFSSFATYLRCAQHWLEAAGVSCAIYSGSMTMKQRHSLLELFHDVARPTSPRVLLATTSSCGVGLNLTCANHCFLMEPSWNPGTEEQALNRIHRIGQVKPVTITKLVADGTIEMNISQLCERKRALSKYCFGDGVTGAVTAAAVGGGSGRLRTADLLELFAPEESSEDSDAEEDTEEEEEDEEW